MAYSTQRSVSDGTLQLLMIEIEFFDKSEITAYFDNIPTTEFIWATDKSLRFDDPVPNGIEVLLRRTTDLAAPRHIFSQGAQFKDSTLDEDFKQILHIAQEAVEGANVGDIYQPLNMHGNPVKNVGPATEDGDAVSLGQVKTESASAWVAAGQAQAALAGVQASAATATNQAGIATSQAGIATTQAGISTAQAVIATNAAASIGISVADAQAARDAAQGHASTATTQAGIATTKAAEAAASADSIALPAFTGKAGYSLVVNAAANAWELVERVTKAAFDAVAARVSAIEARPQIKAKGNFTVAGGVLTARDLYGCTVVRVSVGVYEITFTTPQPTSGYAVGMSWDSIPGINDFTTAGAARQPYIPRDTKTADRFRVISGANASSPLREDMREYSFIVF